MNVVNADEILKDTIQVPVRKTQIPELWDQYLLYGVQTGKRERSEGERENEKTERLSYLSMCLTKNELEENNYMVVKSESNTPEFGIVTHRTRRSVREARLQDHQHIPLR